LTFFSTFSPLVWEIITQQPLRFPQCWVWLFFDCYMRLKQAIKTKKHCFGGKEGMRENDRGN
jgi:hypothetical protein